ncbi:hypothetical protein Plec18167_004724 [Paecilomyces lecythidis]|uniref:Epoxide hydrolase N-terminal domain-containing protein n=1 Tax=Paecilomyces lecythidis TaxID=3004212 RepID=A0ABR3XPU2_9EURO
MPSAAILGYDFPFHNSQPVAFNISVDSTVIDEALTKARLYRPSLDLEDGTNDDLSEGPSASQMHALAAHWAENYDWYQTQDEINANFSHYAVTVPGSPEYNHSVHLHFLHERSPSENAIPLLLIHGWPSSHLEWSQVIKPLVSPEQLTDQHFHVVAPDLPGFGFSPAPSYGGLTPSQMGFAFDHLMHVLGYDKYGVLSTDLGWWVGMWMADVASESLIGHLTDFWIQEPNATDLERFEQNKTAPDETAYINSRQAWDNKHAGYSDIQSKNPLALGQAMTDSPVGYAGYMWTPLRAGSDGHEYSFDELITKTLIVWIQGTWGNLRAYIEFFNAEAMNFPRTKVPTGFRQWLNSGSPFKDIAYFQSPPKSWVERLVNLVYFTTHKSGGHFPAQTRPEVWVKDVRTFFSRLV